MGRSQGKQKQSNAIAVKLDEKGDIKFSDAIARQGVAKKDKIIYSKFTDLLPKQVTEEDPDLARPDQDAIKEVSQFIQMTKYWTGFEASCIYDNTLKLA